MAVQLNPRDESYQLLLARAYLAAKQFAEATETLNRLKASQDPQIASTASKELVDLPFLEKYGVPPEEAKAQKPTSPTSADSDSANADDDDQPAKKPADTQPRRDKRPVKFLKAKLVSVDCSKAPAAVLSVSQGGRLLKLRATDYKSLAVIGAPQFSCAWKDIPVNINYRASGTTVGDLVSIEVPTK